MQMGSECVASAATQIQAFRRRPCSGVVKMSGLSERGHAQDHRLIKYELQTIYTLMFNVLLTAF